MDTAERGDMGWKQAQRQGEGRPKDRVKTGPKTVWRQGDFTDNSNNYTKYNSEKSIDKIWVGIFFTYDWCLAQNNLLKKI